MKTLMGKATPPRQDNECCEQNSRREIDQRPVVETRYQGQKRPEQQAGDEPTEMGDHIRPRTHTQKHKQKHASENAAGKKPERIAVSSF